MFFWYCIINISQLDQLNKFDLFILTTVRYLAKDDFITIEWSNQYL